MESLKLDASSIQQLARNFDEGNSRMCPFRLSHPLIFSRTKMQLEVGILMRRVSYDEFLKCEFGSRNRRERSRHDKCGALGLPIRCT